MFEISDFQEKVIITTPLVSLTSVESEIKTKNGNYLLISLLWYVSNTSPPISFGFKRLIICFDL